jgi:hypothetical protein
LPRSPIACPPYENHFSISSLPDEATYGPWAGKLLTADEDAHLVYAFGKDASPAKYSLGISPDKLLVIPTNQDLYCVFYDDLFLGATQSLILKLSRNALTNYVGSILSEQAGEDSPDYRTQLGITTWSPSPSGLNSANSPPPASDKSPSSAQTPPASPHSVPPPLPPCPPHSHPSISYVLSSVNPPFGASGVTTAAVSRSFHSH